MRKTQKVSFASIEDFLESLPDHEREIVERLRELILNCLPDGTEKLAYNVPYYSRHSRICFIWPASVPWGKVPANSVVLGFCNGSYLQDEINYLEKAGRQQVYTKTFTKLQDIEADLVRAYLFDAAQIDEQLKARKLKKPQGTLK